jgi:hypothetical protein
MHQLFPIIRRQRRPLVIEPEPVAPVVVVAPTAPVAESPKPEALENLKPKKSRDDVAKN